MLVKIGFKASEVYFNLAVRRLNTYKEIRREETIQYFYISRREGRQMFSTFIVQPQVLSDKDLPVIRLGTPLHPTGLSSVYELVHLRKEKGQLRVCYLSMELK